MKIKIEYDLFGKTYRATAYVWFDCFVGLSDKSFEEAKENLIKNIQVVPKDIIIPEPEEVEI